MVESTNTGIAIIYIYINSDIILNIAIVGLIIIVVVLSVIFYKKKLK